MRNNRFYFIQSFLLGDRPPLLENESFYAGYQKDYVANLVGNFYGVDPTSVPDDDLLAGNVLRIDNNAVQFPIYLHPKFPSFRNYQEYEPPLPYCYDSNIYLLIFSTDSYESFDNIESKWFPKISHKISPEKVVIIVGVKSDSKVVSKADVQQLTEKIGSDAYLECENDGAGAKEIFTTAIRLAIHKKNRHVKEDKYAFFKAVSNKFFSHSNSKVSKNEKCGIDLLDSKVKEQRHESKKLINSLREDLEKKRGQKQQNVSATLDEKELKYDEIKQESKNGYESEKKEGSAENVLIVLLDNQCKLEQLTQEVSKTTIQSAPVLDQDPFTVHHEKINIFKKALNLHLSDHFIRNIAISKELADAAFSLETKALMGGFNFVVGQLVPLPFIGLATTLVTETAKYVMQKEKRATARKACLEVTDVTNAAIFVECVVNRLVCRFQLVISRLDPLAITIFAGCLVRRGFLYLQSAKPDLTKRRWTDIADYLVMGACLWNVAEDSLEKSREDNDVLLFYSGKERHHISVNFICHYSPMVTWKLDEECYYQLNQEIKNPNKKSFNLPECYISPFEYQHRNLTDSTKWEHELPIPPQNFSESDIRLKLAQTEAALVQAEEKLEKANETIKKLSAKVERPVSPTHGFGVFDRPLINQRVSESDFNLIMMP